MRRQGDLAQQVETALPRRRATPPSRFDAALGGPYRKAAIRWVTLGSPSHWN